MEAVTRRCSVIIVILKKLRKIHWKTHVPEASGCNFIKNATLAQVHETFENTLFYRTTPVSASVVNHAPKNSAYWIYTKFSKVLLLLLLLLLFF